MMRYFLKNFSSNKARAPSPHPTVELLTPLRNHGSATDRATQNRYRTSKGVGGKCLNMVTFCGYEYHVKVFFLKSHYQVDLN